MKKLTILTILLIAFSFITGCNSDNSQNLVSTEDETTKSTAKLHYVDIMEGDTEKIVSRFYLDDNSQDKLDVFMNSYNYKEETKENFSRKPDYIVHIVNVENSYYDQWYNYYIYNDKLYVQDIPEKKSYTDDLNVTSQIYECTKVNPDEFLELVENSDVDKSQLAGQKSTTASASKPNKEVTSYFSVLDYSTKKEIAKITADTNKRSMTIMDAFNTSTVIDYNMRLGKPKYRIHYVMDRNPKNDIWLDVYLIDNEVYLNVPNIKGSKYENDDICDNIRLTSTVTAEEFLKAVEGE